MHKLLIEYYDRWTDLNDSVRLLFHIQASAQDCVTELQTLLKVSNDAALRLQYVHVDLG